MKRQDAIIMMMMMTMMTMILVDEKPVAQPQNTVTGLWYLGGSNSES